ncbi:MAG: IS1380 family transposase [Erysipelotrichaceae bacterium]|nr:IS1380 family transposase [Erysipelotrichaceae bacterium]
MSILNNLALNSNRQIKINFDGGDLSSDAGLLLIKEFISKLGIEKLFAHSFKTNDSALFRYHTDKENLLQMIYMIIAGYFEDDASDELTNDPVLKAVLGKDALASQPTVSRFFNRMDEDTLNQFLAIGRMLRKKIYSISMPEAIIFDLDSTLLDAYGKQEGRTFNFHYQSTGYHPLLCFDGITGDLIKIQLRDGSRYSCTGVVDFLQPILDEYLEDYPSISLLLRGDSGFATPELYKQCEENGTNYVIRLKENATLRDEASYLVDELNEITHNNKIDYAVVYGEFMYQAGSWPYKRRVVCKVEKPENQMTYMYTFIVTNMDSSPEYLIKFYCKRGRMENFIKESKSGFDFASVSSHSRVVNANRLQVHALAYNIFNWFRRLALSSNMRKQRIDTVRLKLLKIAAKVTRSARYITFKLCSSCPYKDEFYETLSNISTLQVQLE